MTPNKDAREGEGARVCANDSRPLAGGEAAHAPLVDKHELTAALAERDAARAEVARLRAAAQLQPAENMALTVAWHQVERGEEPMSNCAAVCVVALERIRRKTLAATEDQP